jgi:hypothetical protein
MSGIARHGRAHALGDRGLGFLVVVLAEHDAELGDVLARLGRVGVQARAGAADAVQRLDVLVAVVRLLHRAHQRVGLAQLRAGRQLRRHLEAVLRQLRDQVGARA